MSTLLLFDPAFQMYLQIDHRSGQQGNWYAGLKGKGKPQCCTENIWDTCLAAGEE